MRRLSRNGNHHDLFQSFPPTDYCFLYSFLFITFIFFCLYCRLYKKMRNPVNKSNRSNPINMFDVKYTKSYKPNKSIQQESSTEEQDVDEEDEN